MLVIIIATIAWGAYTLGYAAGQHRGRYERRIAVQEIP